jgi:hypothetical protein
MKLFFLSRLDKNSTTAKYKKRGVRLISKMAQDLNTNTKRAEKYARAWTVSLDYVSTSMPDFTSVIGALTADGRGQINGDVENFV